MHSRVAVIALSCLLSLPAVSRERSPSREDLQWLNRVTYGINSQTLAVYQSDGRSKFMRRLFAESQPALPMPVQQQLQALDLVTLDPAHVLADLNAENQRINALPEGDEKVAARKALNDRGNSFAYQARKRDLLRAIYSPAQLQEQLVWFWLNHFSVFEYKANVRWLLPSYEEDAVRPHVFGRFRDLVLATLEHPAMLQYLDNAQNAMGHVNENYARELLELHTLGVNAGYTQEDVQELARILTGVGINASGNEPKLKPEWKPLYRRAGAFEFNPARHDFGTKTLLGKPMAPGGLDEVERAVDLIVSQPGCARFVSTKLAKYFVAEEPSPRLIDEMSKVFQRSHGDIRRVLETMFDSREFRASLGQRFKDPMHFVTAAMRLAYDDKIVINLHPAVNWLASLGQAEYGHISPDGYALTQSAWSSSGQMSRRFEVARAIGSGNAGLFEPEDGSGAKSAGFPFVSSKLFFERIEPLLSTRTQAALAQATSQQEWNTFVLASPEFNFY